MTIRRNTPRSALPETQGSLGRPGSDTTGMRRQSVALPADSPNAPWVSGDVQVNVTFIGLL